MCYKRNPKPNYKTVIQYTCQCRAKYTEAIEALIVFTEQFCFLHIFVFFHKIKVDPDVSKNGHGIVLELRIHKGAWKPCPGKK